MLPPPTTTPPGWYDDPWQPGGKRWWDGSTWTQHVSDMSTSQSAAASHTHDRPAAKPAPKRLWRPRNIAIVSAGLLVAVLAVISVIPAVPSANNATKENAALNLSRKTAQATAADVAKNASVLAAFNDASPSEIIAMSVVELSVDSGAFPDLTEDDLVSTPTADVYSYFDDAEIVSRLSIGYPDPSDRAVLRITVSTYADQTNRKNPSRPCWSDVIHTGSKYESTTVACEGD